MLRFLMFLLLLPGMAFANGYKEPSKELIDAQRNEAARLLNNARSALNSGELGKILNIEREHLNLSTTDKMNSGFNIPSFLEGMRDDTYMAKALAAGKKVQEGSEYYGYDIFPIVMVSMSMPEAQIRSLIAEAAHVEALVVVRGLINDDFPGTINKLRELAGDKAGGVMIDPTLFERFNIQAVPAFVLPKEPLKLCNQDGCETPDHIKAAGSATIKYFLETIGRVGDAEEKQLIKTWLAKYKE